MELDQLRRAAVRHETVCVHAKAVNMPEGARDTVSSHRPEKSMQSAGLLAEEVPGRVVSSRSLRDLTVTSGLDGVDQVRELDGILDEEHGDVVSHEI